MRFLIAFILVSMSSVLAKAQGDVQIVADSQLYTIQKLRVERKKTLDTKPDTLIVEGYRVQIYFSNDRKKAFEKRDKLRRLFPEYAEEVYVPYQSPNYKVRVGNFIKESDAKALERILSKSFENVFIVRDRVRYIKNRPQENDD